MARFRDLLTPLVKLTPLTFRAAEVATRVSTHRRSQVAEDTGFPHGPRVDPASDSQEVKSLPRPVGSRRRDLAIPRVCGGLVINERLYGDLGAAKGASQATWADPLVQATGSFAA